MTNQVLYLGSHLGDSQLLQLTTGPTSLEAPSSLIIPEGVKTVSKESLTTVLSKKGKGKADVDDHDMDVDSEGGDDYSKGRVVEPSGSYLTVLEAYKNIAPIMDAVLVDVDGSGQVKVTTAFRQGESDIDFAESNRNVQWRSQHRLS